MDDFLTLDFVCPIIIASKAGNRCEPRHSTKILRMTFKITAPFSSGTKRANTL